MADIDPMKVAELLGDLNHASHRTARAFAQRRGTKAGVAAKRRAVDGLFWLLFGRKATEDEHRAATTDDIGYY